MSIVGSSLNFTVTPRASSLQRTSETTLSGSTGASTLLSKTRIDNLVARGDAMADGSDNMNLVTGFAALAGLGTGVIIAQITEGLSDFSRESGNISEDMMAEFSASAGMEDVEKPDENKQMALIEAMRKAQNLTDEEVEELKRQKRREKISADDGW